MPFIDTKQARVDIVNALALDADDPIGRYVGGGVYVYRTVYYYVRDGQPVWV